MTEKEWQTCDDPVAMALAVRNQATERKLRLFACACYFRIAHRLADEFSAKVVQTVAAYADGQASADSLRQAHAAAARAALDYEKIWLASKDTENAGNALVLHAAYSLALQVSNPDPMQALRYSAGNASWTVAAIDNPGIASYDPSFRASEVAEKSAQCALMRDIIGNPFQPSRPEDIRLSWKGGRLPKLAEGVYQEGAFDRLPILADALEEAGCADADVLGHCRGPGPHVRGCWVVDLILGKS